MITYVQKHDYQITVSGTRWGIGATHPDIDAAKNNSEQTKIGFA
jgi:hypothetical protein